MSPDFWGDDIVILQPLDRAVPYNFEFTVNSSAIANDGALPYQTTITDYAVTAHKATSGVDVSAELIASLGRSDFIITVKLSYPPTHGNGKYHLTFTITLSNAAVMEFDFNRIYCRDR